MQLSKEENKSNPYKMLTNPDSGKFLQTLRAEAGRLLEFGSSRPVDNTAKHDMLIKETTTIKQVRE